MDELGEYADKSQQHPIGRDYHTKRTRLKLLGLTIGGYFLLLPSILWSLLVIVFTVSGKIDVVACSINFVVAMVLGALPCFFLLRKARQVKTNIAHELRPVPQPQHEPASLAGAKVDSAFGVLSNSEPAVVPTVSNNSAKQATHDQEITAMSSDLITSDNVSPQFLQSVFDSAFMNASINSDGHVYVQGERLNYLVIVSDAKDYISYFCLLGLRPHIDRSHALAFCNRANQRFIMIRAFVPDDNTSIRFDYDLLVCDGINKKMFVDMARRFESIVVADVVQCDVDKIFL